MDTKGLFEFNSKKMNKKGKLGLGKVNLLGGKRKKGLKSHKVHGLL